MGADLCHQEHLFAAPVPERSAQDGLSLAVVILPSVVEKSNAGVYCFVNELHRLVQRRHIAEMMTTHPNSGNVFTRTSKAAIDHVALVPRWRSPRSPWFCIGDVPVRICRGGGCGGHSTGADSKKVPPSRIHLYASWRRACMKSWTWFCF